jgi:hypothetical protein
MLPVSMTMECRQDSAVKIVICAGDKRQSPLYHLAASLKTALAAKLSPLRYSYRHVHYRHVRDPEHDCEP